VTGDGFDAVLDLLDWHCIGCHRGSQAPDLSGDICRDVVGAPSVGLPSMNYITAGDPENSYLFHRMNNTGSDVGGSASPMPPTGVISEEELQLIEDWITDGANCIDLPEGEPDPGGDPDVDPGDGNTDDTGGGTSDTSSGETLITNSCTNSCHNGTDMGILSSRFSDDIELASVIRGEVSGPMSGVPAASTWSDQEVGFAIAYLRSIE
jgi:hypothetical protein